MIFYQTKVMRLLLLLTCILPLIQCQTSCLVSAWNITEMCFQYSSCQMKMFIPEVGYQQSFVVYYTPDNGSQENIIRCRWLEAYKCNPNGGYSLDFPDNKSILITLPRNLQPGNFSLQIHKNSDDTHCICSWNPKGNSIKPEVKNGSIENDNNLGVIIGPVLGVVIIILVIGFLLFKKYKSKKRNLHRHQHHPAFKKNDIEQSQKEPLHRQENKGSEKNVCCCVL